MKADCGICLYLYLYLCPSDGDELDGSKCSVGRAGQREREGQFEFAMES